MKIFSVSAKSEEVHKILDDGSSRFFRYVIDRVGEGIDSEPEDREMICAMCQHAVGGIMHEWLSRENADKSHCQISCAGQLSFLAVDWNGL
mgnify:CR=1 FL=1